MTNTRDFNNETNTSTDFTAITGAGADWGMIPERAHTADPDGIYAAVEAAIAAEEASGTHPLTDTFHTFKARAAREHATVSFKTPTLTIYANPLALQNDWIMGDSVNWA